MDGHGPRIVTGKARGAVLLLMAVAAGGAPLHAQDPPIWLPVSHWSHSLIARQHALGGAAVDPTVWVHTQDEAAAALETLPAQRLEARGGTRVQAAAEVQFLMGRGAVSPAGYTLDRVWTGPHRRRDVAGASVRGRASVLAGRRVALAAELVAAKGAAAVEHATVAVTAGPVQLWAGRRAVGYRPGEGGGLVLSGLERFDGAGVRTARPLAVPLVGPLTGETFFGPLPGNGHVRSPWLAGLRVHARLHPRFDAGATRAAVFGGLDGARLGPLQLAGVVVGTNLGGRYADDQVASVDARWRPPWTGLPLEFYGEWGMHDMDPGVLLQVAAYTLGLRLPRVAAGAAGELGLGIEYTRIGGSCCGNPPWYHHFELADGWVVDGELLGHPLGGHGREWRLTAGGTGASGQLLVHGALALRTRQEENLVAPAREGRAVAFEVAADLLATRHISLETRLRGERGAGWRSLHSATAVRWRM